jgi:hypothetical protein
MVARNASACAKGAASWLKRQGGACALAWVLLLAITLLPGLAHGA